MWQACCNPVRRQFLQGGAGIVDACDSQSAVVSKAELMTAVNAQTFLCLHFPLLLKKYTFLSDKRSAFTSSAAIMYCSNCTVLLGKKKKQHRNLPTG